MRSCPECQTTRKKPLSHMNSLEMNNFCEKCGYNYMGDKK